MDNTPTITHVSLCAGYGGIDLGLKRAIPSLRTIAFSEIEAFACANLVAKMEAGLLDPAPIWTDLKTFPWAEFRGCVDILSGGYPCQPFSAAGKRLGAEDPRHLWPHISAGIAAMRPSVCFFENVEGHISLGLPDVIEDLAGLGYRTTWGIFSASEVGAPHQRKRVFILAHDQSLGIRGRWPSWLQEPRPHAGQALPLRGGDAGGTAWPSRPGEHQHWWEPPRVVASASARQQAQRDKSYGQWREDAVGESSELGNTSSAGHAGPARSSSECTQGQSLGHAAESNGAMGHPNSPRPQERPRQQRAGLQGTDADGGARLADTQSSQRRITSTTDNSGRWIAEAGGSNGESNEQQIIEPMGLHLDGTADGLGVSELSGFSHQELAEIREWMVRSDNRTDELRLLGNGVVPATAERAFRVLVAELMEHANQ